MNFYEAVFIVKSDASPSHVESVSNAMVSTVKEFGGEITKTEFHGLRQLAYPIKKNKKGHYVLLNIISNSDGIAELERKFRLNEDVIRFLIVKVDKLDNNPSALMQKPA
ncbi:MAG: 30S ribosomal protein S6 [Holosporales bacterium]|jgi:small subunit ribosomal protein S6|nr:30S ribosomal protein S6 [Holosporales bacterium]